MNSTSFEYWLSNIFLLSQKFSTITFRNVVFWVHVLTWNLTVEKRLGISNLDKNKRFPFLYLSSLILNKPSLKFSYLWRGIYVLLTSESKEITKFKVNNIWNSRAHLRVAVISCYFASISSQLSPAVTSKRKFSFCHLIRRAKLKFPLWNSRLQANPTLFW